MTPSLSTVAHAYGRFVADLTTAPGWAGLTADQQCTLTAEAARWLRTFGADGVDGLPQYLADRLAESQ